MNWSKGKGTGGRGGSFKATVEYVTRDKDGLGSERVGGVEMLNLADRDPKRSWREMQTTADAMTAIKARNGIKQTGQKNEKPVYHYALSWHADDKPDRAHMLAKAKETISLLGLSAHQALIVEHTDRPHKHVHIVVNLIHPETGRTANLRYDEVKLDRWAHQYETSRNTIRSFDRAAKFERIMERKKDTARDGFEQAKERREQFGPPKPEVKPEREGLSGAHDAAMKATKLKERLEEKRAGLAGKHDAAKARREAEKSEAFKDYKDRKAQIQEKYQPAIDRVWKPKTPALEMAPPGVWRRHDWMHMAKAMLQAGMAERRWPINQAFTRALSRIATSTPERIVNLKQKFKLVDERKHVMLPIRHTEKMRKFAEPHIEGRTSTKKVRTESLKEARRIETLMAVADYEVKKDTIIKAHAKEMGHEKAERLQLRAEAHRSWADLRKEHGLPQRESKWQEDRDAHKQAFNKAAEDRNTVKTEITDKDWQKGTVGDFTYEAKVHAKDSPFGIKAGNVSALDLRDKNGNQVAHFDRDWDSKPAPWQAEHGAVEAVVKFYKEHAHELQVEQTTPIEYEPDITPTRQKSEAEIVAEAPDISSRDPMRDWDWAVPEQDQGWER